MVVVERLQRATEMPRPPSSKRSTRSVPPNVLALAALPSLGVTSAQMLIDVGIKDEATLRFILASDPELTRARLALVRGAAIVIASGLAVFGVEPVQEM